MARFYKLPNGNLVDPDSVAGVQAFPDDSIEDPDPGRRPRVVVRCDSYAEVIYVIGNNDALALRDRIAAEIEEASAGGSCA